MVVFSFYGPSIADSGLLFLVSVCVCMVVCVCMHETNFSIGHKF